MRMISRHQSDQMFRTSRKDQIDHFENSNSHKRRFNEQARLLKIKNFPSDFFGNATKEMRSRQMFYSVDRVVSRRQRRNVHKTDTNLLQFNSNGQHQNAKRIMSEGRPSKRALSSEKIQNLISLVKATSGDTSAPGLKQRGQLNKPSNSSLKSSSLA